MRWLLLFLLACAHAPAQLPGSEGFQQCVKGCASQGKEVAGIIETYEAIVCVCKGEPPT